MWQVRVGTINRATKFNLATEKLVLSINQTIYFGTGKGLFFIFYLGKMHWEVGTTSCVAMPTLISREVDTTGCVEIKVGTRKFLVPIAPLS